MKISHRWLQKYFDQPLPNVQILSDAFTFHSFEIEEIVDETMDVKVLPNRAADCLSHRGLAKELSAILEIPLKNDSFCEGLPVLKDNKTKHLFVKIEDSKTCLRYCGAYVHGVKVGPSPMWLKEALESIGQRSINNIVDATNYVMFDIGQPLHAFDAQKLTLKSGTYAVGVRNAKDGETITTLSGDEITLSQGTPLIIDGYSDIALGIAGVKGGSFAEVTVDTTDLIIESANFDGTTIRRSAQALKLFTDASLRFQNRPSPELVAHGMRDVLKLIMDIAGGDIVDLTDVYPTQPVITPVSNSRQNINGLLGSDFTNDEILSVFHRLGLGVRQEGDTFTVVPPFERTDLVIPEDLTEEVGRILGYDRVVSTELPPITGVPDQSRYRGIERMKDQLVGQGFIELSTQSFAKKGDIYLANPLDKTKPALRTSLKENLDDALVQSKYYSPLVLSTSESPKLFEIGTVFLKDGEHLELQMTERVPEWGEGVGVVDNLSVAKMEEYGKDYVPNRYALSAYKPFSTYPFISRDIALWVPESVSGDEVEKILKENGGELLIQCRLFDEFKKDGKVSYAFRLIFQSFDRTLTDDEVGKVMDSVTGVLKERGFEVR